MSSKAKIKGTRVENEIVKLYKKEGYKARRQPMSGAISAFPHDVYIDDLHEGTNAEVMLSQWEYQKVKSSPISV